MGFWETVSAAGLGAFLVTVIKEILGFHLNKSSLVESDRDDDLKLIEDTVYEIREMSCDYWEVPDEELNTARSASRITSRLLHVGQVVERLFRDEESALKAVNAELNRFDDRIQHGSYGVRDRAAEPTRILEIEQDAVALTNRARDCRRKLKRRFIRFKRA